MRIDVHQHVWTEPLLEALARRTRAPRVRRAGREWALLTDSEPEYRIPDGGDLPARTRLLASDRVDLAIVTPSLPVGIESLAPEEALPLLAAYRDGVDQLPRGWRAWGSLPLAAAQPHDVDALIDAGFVGLCVPATSLATPPAVDRLAPLLARLESRGAPLFVHPGPAAPGHGGADAPAWWPAMTSYVAQMNAAWHAYVGFGRRRHPELRVLFAMLAGGAPLHLERLANRRGRPHEPLGDRAFYDTSSYGPRALRAMAHWVGTDQLVYGSDRPLAQPLRTLFGSKRDEAMRRGNPARLLPPMEVAA
jgi:hypothetical protein